MTATELKKWLDVKTEAIKALQQNRCPEGTGIKQCYMVHGGLHLHQGIQELATAVCRVTCSVPYDSLYWKVYFYYRDVEVFQLVMCEDIVI